MFKNLLHAANHWGPGAESLSIRFSHVRWLDHKNTSKPYFCERIKDLPPRDILSELTWVDARKYKESDMADLFAGFLHRSLEKDKYGKAEGAYLENIWHLVRHTNQCDDLSTEWCAIPLGFMPMPAYKVARDLASFPCKSCPQANK